jgi:hypothetical protein
VAVAVRHPARPAAARRHRLMNMIFNRQGRQEKQFLFFENKNLAFLAV